MASFRNIDIQDQGVNWRVAYEWNVDDQTGPWTAFEAVFPRDFGEINPDDVTTEMFEIAAAVARGQGVHD